MPITNFLEITQELSLEEKEIVPVLINGLKRRTYDNPIKAPEIVLSMNIALKQRGKSYKMTQPRLRQMCNYIRVNSLLPLMATSKGYFCAKNKDELRGQIMSLNERANSILKSANGLEKLLNKDWEDLLK